MNKFFLSFLLLFFASPNLNAQKISEKRKVENEMDRKMAIFTTKVKTFKYIYKNNQPFGTKVQITYDTFYQKYSLSFTDENGFRNSIKISDSNFKYEDSWIFNFNGNKYKVSDGF